MTEPRTPKLDPSALPLDEAAHVLSKLSGELVTLEQLERDLDSGAPINTDGTLNLVRYAAWLLWETKRGDRS